VPGICEARDCRHFSNILWGGIEKAQERNFSIVSNININIIIMIVIMIIITIIIITCGCAREPTAA